MCTREFRLPERVDVIGVPISATNMNECLELIEEGLDEFRGEYICVSNVHTTVTAHDDPAYFKVQADAVMTLPDGKPLSVIGRREYPEMGRVTGPDLMREILAVSQDRNYSHYFYGTTDETLTRLRGELLTSYPNLKIAGMKASVFRRLSDSELEELIAEINETRPDFLWVALGAPRQEIFCARIKGRTPALAIGVGGAFKILARIIPEAPVWVQNLGFEWLYRLVQDPRRLMKRYLVTNSRFIYYALSGAPCRKERSHE